MPKQKPLTDAKGEVRGLTASDLKAFRPARKALPESLRRKADPWATEVSDQRANHDSAVAQCSSKLSRYWRRLANACRPALQDWLRKHKRAA